MVDFASIFGACFGRNAEAHSGSASDFSGSGSGGRRGSVVSDGSGRLEAPVSAAHAALDRALRQKLTLVQSLRSVVEDPRLSPQANAPREAMFYLRKILSSSENGYRMESIENGVQHVPDGTYVFVIPEHALTEVVCGVWERHDRALDLPTVAGHAGLAQQGQTVFAGHLYFDHGQLLKWSNASGHYQFPGYVGESRLAFPPHIRLLLPSDRYARHHVLR